MSDSKALLKVTYEVRVSSLFRFIISDTVALL